MNTTTGAATTEPSTSEPSPESSAAHDRGRALGAYHPGLDGLRAVAMTVMLAYHSELPFARGAFLGLSQFFTLSGFLITSMLLRSGLGSGIDLKEFWRRRVERLMPAAMVCLALIVVFGATVANQQQVDELGMDVFSASTYWANWHFVLSDKSYVNLFAAPSPVQHYWSLAVEEQFYLVMPLFVVFLVARTRSLKVIGATFAVGAVLSAGWLVHLYRSGAGLDRVYYGTDTRMSEMLIGALLAVIVTAVGSRFTERSLRTMGWVGVGAFAISAWGSTSIPLADGPMWRGGLFGYSFISCLVIMGIMSQRGPLAPALSWGPLPAIGRVTYGLYLYHWPIFLWLTEARTGWGPWPLFFARLGLTFGAAAASYNLLEMPIRNGALRRLVPGRARLAIGPLVVLAVVSAGFVVSANRTADDPLATIRSDDSSLVPPLQPGDGVLDILVIADDADRPVVDRLVEHDRTDTSLRVTVAPFECRSLVEIEGGRTCADWADEWPDLVADHDPDLVLLYVKNWEEEDLRALDPDEDPRALAQEALGTGFDLLVAKDARVLWAVPASDLATGIALAGTPFHDAMRLLEVERSDLSHVLGTRLPPPGTVDEPERVEKTAAALIADASLYQRIDREAGTRVLVLGDSQARSLAFGLERWSAANGEAVVWNAASEGCGLVAEGVVSDPTGDAPISDRCRAAVAAWPSQVDSFRPDVVIVLTSVWDLRDRRLTADGELLAPGDPRFDDLLVDTYTDAIDVWTATGARVIWMEAPCSRFEPQPGSAVELPASYDRERTEHLNDVILREVVAQRPAVELFDLDAVLCPGGSYQREIDGVDPVRIDGIHFSVEGALWFAERYGDTLIR